MYKRQAHDQRDFLFARKYNLPIKVVISPRDTVLDSNMEEAYEDPGYLVNSGPFDGLFYEDAQKKITVFLAEKRMGGFKTSYRLRDWLISVSYTHLDVYKRQLQRSPLGIAGLWIPGYPYFSAGGEGIL